MLYDQSPEDTKVTDEMWDATLQSRFFASFAKCLDTDPTKSPYPDLLLFMLAVLTRVTGSQNSMLKRLSKGAWNGVRHAYQAQFEPNPPLPKTPPTARVMDEFMIRLVKDKDRVEQLEETFTRAACGFAVGVGLFPAGVSVDYANPRIEHCVFGDGTYMEPFSGVQRRWDPTEQRYLYVGSRSKHDNPRIQTLSTDSSQDQKQAVGVNHVSVSAWSPDHGWIVLATGQAFGAEGVTAQALLQRVHTFLGDRLHHIVWDRAITGWLSEWSLQVLHASVINKAVARGSRRISAPVVSMTHADAVAAYRAGAPLPLGTTVYPRGEDRHWAIRSQFHHFGQPPGVLDCSHDLYVDDGALHDTLAVGPGRIVKTAPVTATSSTGREQSGAWVVTTEWELPCAQAPSGKHTFTTEYRPRTSGQQRIPGAFHTALREARPVPRLDQARFAPVGNMRNLTESLNNWIKKRMGTGTRRGRAQRLDVRKQRIDHLCASVLANAVTEVTAFGG